METTGRPSSVPSHATATPAAMIWLFVVRPRATSYRTPSSPRRRNIPLVQAEPSFCDEMRAGTPPIVVTIRCDIISLSTFKLFSSRAAAIATNLMEQISRRAFPLSSNVFKGGWMDQYQSVAAGLLTSFFSTFRTIVVSYS